MSLIFKCPQCGTTFVPSETDGDTATCPVLKVWEEDGKILSRGERCGATMTKQEDPDV